MDVNHSKSIEFLKDFGIALQHLFLVLPITLAVPELFGSSIGLNNSEMLRLTQMSLMTAGIVSLIFSFSRSNQKTMHMVIGADMALLAIGIRAASYMTLSGYFGLIIIGGIISFILSLTTRFWLRWITPPVMIASMILYAISFAPVAMDWLLGGVGSPDYGSHRNVLVGIAVIVFTLFLDQYGKGFIKHSSVGLGFIFGIAMSVPMGLVRWTRTVEVDFLQAPRFFAIKPTIQIDSLGWLIPIVLLLLLKQVFDLQVMAKQLELAGEERQSITEVGLRRYGFGMFISVIAGSVGLSAPQPNFGFAGLGHKHARKPFVMVSILLILLGLSPWLTNIFSLVPLPVVGAIAILLSAALVNQLLHFTMTRLWKSKEVQIVAFSVLFGIMAMLKPDSVAIFGQSGRVILESGFGITFITALIMQLIIPEY